MPACGPMVSGSAARSARAPARRGATAARGAPENAAADRRARRDARVQAQQIRFSRSGEIESLDAGQQDGDEIGATGLRNRHQYAAWVALRRCSVQRILQPGDFGSRIEALELRIVFRIRSIPEIFLPERDDGFVDERLAQTRDLHEAAAIVAAAVLAQDAHTPAARARVDA